MMLTFSEMHSIVWNMWTAMTDEDWRFDLYYERPLKGQGYHGGGEFYLYISGDCYILSYSERGTENILVKSKTFDDIQYEIAKLMSETVISYHIKKHKWKYSRIFKESISWQAEYDMRLKLLERVDTNIYEKAKREYEQILESNR